MDAADYNGNAIAFLQQQADEEWERDYLRIESDVHTKIPSQYFIEEERFYQGNTTKALEMAVMAFQRAIERQKKKMEFKDLSSDSKIDAKHFIRLKDKESVAGIFRGKPYDFKQHWINNRSQLCTGPGCELCANKNKPSFRFRLNFVVKENGSAVAKIFEQGFIVYQQLHGLNQDYPLEKHFVKITRNGVGQDTTYTILPVPNGTLSVEQEKIISAVPLHDLKNLPKEEKNESPITDEEIPF